MEDYLMQITNFLLTQSWHIAVLAVVIAAVSLAVENIEDRIKTIMNPGKKFYKRASITTVITVVFLAALTVPTTLALTTWTEDKTDVEIADENQSSRSSLREKLQAAIAGGDIDKVEKLIEEGVSVNMPGKEGMTPLRWAVNAGNKEIIELLIKSGANVNIPDDYGNTPLHISGTKPQADTAKYLEIARVLIASGADLNAKARSNRTPLHLCAKYGNKDISELLVASGASIDLKDDFGKTPLLYAASVHKNVSELLIENGADVAMKDKYGQTPLHLAANWGHEDIVRLFIEKGADVNAKDNNGLTPLDYATKKKYREVMKLLAAKGGYSAYKLEDFELKRVFVPDVDDKAVMLDLASGELVDIPEPVTGLEVLAEIEELEKGDITYDNRSLIFVRGATPNISDVHSGPGSVKVYEIGNGWLLPERMIVTSCSGERYELTIIVANKLGCRINYYRLEKNKPDVQVEVEGEKKKMIELTVKEIFLPDVEDSKLVLDLTTGELIEIPFKDDFDLDDENVIATFQKLKKGDLIWENNCIICLRGSTMEGEPFFEKGFPFPWYEIPKYLPFATIVTTAEGRRYNLNVLEDSRSKGCLLAYSPISSYAETHPKPFLFSRPSAEEVELVESTNKLHELGKGCLIYASDYEEKYPDSLRDLQEYVEDEDLEWLLENVEYLGKGKTPSDRPDMVIAYDKSLLELGQGTNVLFLDTHVAFETPERLEELGISKAKRTKAATRGKPANVAVYEQLEEVVELSELTPEMPFNEAIEILKMAPKRPLKVIVLWRDLYENAEIDQTTPINMDAISGVPLGVALEFLLKSVSGGFAELGYVVEDRVIVVATMESLPSKMIRLVYDITDLIEGEADANDAVQRITEMVEPDSWEKAGGKGTITIYHDYQGRKLKVVVYQTREIHQEMQELLGDTRSLSYEQVKTETGIERNAINKSIDKQLDEIVELSELTAEMAFSEAIEVIKYSVEPPLKIVVLWRDLYENAEIDRTTPINMDAISGVSLGTALKLLLKSVSGGFAELGYVVEDGVIIIATKESLPRKPETRTYDISDLTSKADDSGLESIFL